MRILLVNDYAAPTAGSERQSVWLRDELRRRGHDARIFASRVCPAGWQSLADYHCFGTASRWQTIVAMANPSAYRQLKHAVARFRPDVVHVKLFMSQLSPLILPVLARIPSLLHVVTHNVVCPTGAKLLPDGMDCPFQAGTACLRNCVPLYAWIPLMGQRMLWRRWHGTFNVTVAPSRQMADVVSADGLGPSEVIWNGVPIRPRRPALSEPPTVAYAGRLVSGKGVDVLLEAFAEVVQQMKDARLIIAGDGPLRSRLAGLATDLGIRGRLEMAGHLTDEDMETRLGRAWLQVLPSCAESFGNVVAEAMVRGTAIVASDVGGPRDVIRNGQTGFLVPPRDPKALARALLTILRDKSVAEEMGAAARRFALEQLTIEKSVDNLMPLYERLASEGKMRP